MCHVVYVLRHAWFTIILLLFRSYEEILAHFTKFSEISLGGHLPSSLHQASFCHLFRMGYLVMMGHNQKKGEEISKKEKQPCVMYDKLLSQIHLARYPCTRHLTTGPEIQLIAF